jgi:hypothetical protein
MPRVPKRAQLPRGLRPSRRYGDDRGTTEQRETSKPIARRTKLWPSHETTFWEHDEAITIREYALCDRHRGNAVGPPLDRKASTPTNDAPDEEPTKRFVLAHEPGDAVMPVDVKETIRIGAMHRSQEKRTIAWDRATIRTPIPEEPPPDAPGGETAEALDPRGIDGHPRVNIVQELVFH